MRPARGAAAMAAIGRCQLARVLPATQPTAPFEATISRSSSLPAKNTATCWSLSDDATKGDEVTGGTAAEFAGRTGFPTGGRKPGKSQSGPVGSVPDCAIVVEKPVRIKLSKPT